MKMDAMRTLEFWATIIGLVIGIFAIGSLFFGWFQLSSVILLSVLVLLIILVYAYVGNRHGHRGRRKKWIIITILVIFIIIVLNKDSVTNLYNKIQISSIPNSQIDINNPIYSKCEQKITQMIDDNQSLYIWFNNEQGIIDNGIKLEPVKLEEKQSGVDVVDSITEYWRIFGQPKVSSTIRWGVNAGENRNWFYGGIIWDYPAINQQVTDSNGVIKGDNVIKFNIQIKEFSYYIKNNIASSRSLIGYGGQASAVDKIITLPLKDVLKITECKLVD